MNKSANLFNRPLQRLRRDRIASGLMQHDFLIHYAAQDIAERLSYIRKTFPMALNLGSHTGQLGELLKGDPQIGLLQHMDRSIKMLQRTNSGGICADEEALPFADHSFDTILSVLTLHQVNDMPGALIQCWRALKPDGLLLVNLLGGDTLTELRQCFAEAEAQVKGGISPRIAPMLDLRDAAALLQRAGFALPVADMETVTVTYDHPLKLMQELRAMGEANSLLSQQKGMMSKTVLAAAIDAYQRRFTGEDGRITARFDILTLTGWKPHESQQQPLKPGSGQVSLTEILKK